MKEMTANETGFTPKEILVVHGPLGDTRYQSRKKDVVPGGTKGQTSDKFEGSPQTKLGFLASDEDNVKLVRFPNLNNHVNPPPSLDSKL